MKNIALILWPSFLVGGVAVGIFFTMVDPQELYLFGEPVHFTKLATYSIGFFAFWGLGAASSLLTFFLMRSAEEINRHRSQRKKPARESIPQPPSPAG